MHRREFLAALPCATLAQNASSPSLNAFAEILFLDILRGYATNLAKTSDSYAAIEYPGATVTKSFLTRSGLSVTGVTRMLPAIAAWISAKRQPSVLSIDGNKFDLLDVVGSALVNGTNPGHKDYWQQASGTRQDQRQVEASVVAWTVWLLRDSLLPQMASEERRRIDAWLASCTVVPVRNNNWAWFTAVNHAARIDLKDKFDEFSFSQAAMFDDLRALAEMYSGGGGWYNDHKPGAAFDYYNSWVFASHFLYWNMLAGSRYPEWSRMFGERVRAYLETAPLFFGSNGSHVLYGRSLIYRWAVLTPMVLAYVQKLWPHDASTLHRIVRSNLEFHVTAGAFDSSAGKLREKFAPGGTVDIRETYIDGGHPYWSMQAFALWMIPREDPFWAASSGLLPVERADFRRGLDSPGLYLAGAKSSGQVRLIQARSSRMEPEYRDKYNKLVYSTHFPLNIVSRPDICAWDNALVLRDRRSRKSAGRSEITESRLLPDGAEMAFAMTLSGLQVNVRTTVLTEGEFDLRIHRVIAPDEVNAALELVDGSSALGLQNQTDVEFSSSETFSVVRNRKTGMVIASWPGPAWEGSGAAWDFGSSDSAGSNLISPAMLVNSTWAPLKPGVQVLYVVHYASPRPLPNATLQAQAQRLLARARAIAGGAPAAPVPRQPRLPK